MAGDPRRAIDRLPAVHDPRPACIGVEPTQRPAGGRRSVVITGVALERFGVRGAPGRCGVLVGRQLLPGGQRQRWKLIEAADGIDGDTGGVELAGVETVGAVDRREQGAEPALLAGGELGARRALGVIRAVARRRGHASCASALAATANRSAMSAGISVARIGSPGRLATQATVSVPRAAVSPSFSIVAL